MLWDSRSWITDYYNETGDLTTYYKGMEIGEIWVSARRASTPATPTP